MLQNYTHEECDKHILRNSKKNNPHVLRNGKKQHGNIQ